MKKGIAILGSTGSIGTQTLEVIKSHPEHFSLEALTANNNIELLIQQAKEFLPDVVVVANENLYQRLKTELKELPIKVFAGSKAIEQIVEMGNINTVVTAMVGFAGLLPTLNAIKYGKNIALANKETLVVAGGIISKLSIENKAAIIPVDSEHSAIFQCLVGEGNNPIERILLTASGGPFHGKNRAFLENVQPEQALRHPNWEMGAKITIDSASLMNKGLEAIEAKWLFDLQPEQIQVVVHRQSIIHSMVEFTDGSIKAQMGNPNMKLPILYALTFPHRLKSDFPRFNFLDYPQLTFEKPDFELFKNLKLAYQAMNVGGNMPCVLNAANEIAVDAFLNRKIKFLEMPEIIEQCLNEVEQITNPDIDCLIETDRISRQKASLLIQKK